MKFPAILIIVLAVVIAVVPQFFNCQHDGKTLILQDGRQVPMKCYWTARVALALSIPIFAMGVIAFFNQAERIRRTLAVLTSLMGLLVILLPTRIIGVCSHPGASCNLVMKPVLIFCGILVIAVGLILGIIQKRKFQ